MRRSPPRIPCQWLRMARPRLNPDWLSTAERIRSELADAEFGGREAIFRRNAEKGVHSVASLRRDVTAATFIASVEKLRPEFGAVLRTLSSSMVTELARLYRTDPEGAVQKSIATAKGLLTGTEMTKGRTRRPIQASRRLREHQKRSFFEFVKAHEPRISGYWDEEVFGLPNTRVVFLDGVDSQGVVAYAHVDDKGARVTQLLTYLGLLRYYDYVFLGISLDHLPTRWAKYLYLTDPKGLRVLDPQGLGISIYGPSAVDFSNLIETHTWPEHD